MSATVNIDRVGVVGCGLMGAGIAEVCARHELDVVVVEADRAASVHGRSRVEASLDTARMRGKIDQEQCDAALGRLLFAADLAALHDRQLIIEAIPENEAAKLSVFSRIDDALDDESAILASNTSSIPIMKLAMTTRRPDRVVGMHFFNPVQVLPLVEVVSSLLTDQTVASRVATLAKNVLDKHVVYSQDRAGFIVNALLVPYLTSAIRMLESGFATAGDIDAGMVHGCAHPMGPLAVADLIGLDTTLAVAQSLYEEFKEPVYAPPPLLSRMVEAGLLGRKSGRGFFEYPR